MRTIKKNWIYLFFLFSLLLFLATRLIQGADRIHLSVRIIHGADGGWGYDLYKNDSIYIHQQFIPAIAGRKSFSSEADAGKIGNLALAKLGKSRFPVITLAELDSCGIVR